MNKFRKEIMDSAVLKRINNKGSLDNIVLDESLLDLTIKETIKKISKILRMKLCDKCNILLTQLIIKDLLEVNEDGY